jgi:hypothetical protein
LAKFNETPLIDDLRGRIEPGDIGWLKRMAQDSGEEQSALGISLLRSVQKESEVRQFLFDLWKNDTSYHRRWWVMFRLLDYPDLSIEMHRELFQFAKTNWTRWLDDVVNYFGGPAELLKALQARLADTSWPESKTWVRVIEAVGASDEEAISKFLSWVSAKRPQAPLVSEALEFAKGKMPGRTTAP